MGLGALGTDPKTTIIKMPYSFSKGHVGKQGMYCQNPNVRKRSTIYPSLPLHDVLVGLGGRILLGLALTPKMLRGALQPPASVLKGPAEAAPARIVFSPVCNAAFVSCKNKSPEETQLKYYNYWWWSVCFYRLLFKKMQIEVILAFQSAPLPPTGMEIFGLVNFVVLILYFLSF